MQTGKVWAIVDENNEVLDFFGLNIFAGKYEAKEFLKFMQENLSEADQYELKEVIIEIKEVL